MRGEVAPKNIQYLVLPDVQNPWLLARVRWPDVFQAISPARPHWQSDPGLFDLPYDPSGVPVTAQRAEAIAAEWGATLPSEADGSVGPSFIRRMPANWSNLSPAEKRAWCIGPEPRARSGRWWRRRAREVATATEPLMSIDSEPEQVIDLTDSVMDLTDTSLADVTWTDFE